MSVAPNQGYPPQGQPKPGIPQPPPVVNNTTIINNTPAPGSVKKYSLIRK